MTSSTTAYWLHEASNKLGITVGIIACVIGSPFVLAFTFGVLVLLLIAFIVVAICWTVLAICRRKTPIEIVLNKQVIHRDPLPQEGR